MKKINVPKLMWVTSIFGLLIFILFLVMDYKINYQYSKPSKLLYFYECDGSLCTSMTEEKNKTIYSSLDCYYESCPKYKKIIYDDYALLEEKNNSYILFNYKTGTVVTSGYQGYEFINVDYVIVKKNNKYGVIDLEEHITVSPSYDSIGYYQDKILTGFNTNSILAKKNNKYGIISYKDGKVVDDFKYNENDIPKLLDKITVT